MRSLRMLVVFAVALVVSAASGAMYDIRDVCVDESGERVSLAPCGEEITLPPIGADGWTIGNHRNILKAGFGEDIKGRFFALEGSVAGYDTAWHIRSSISPVNAAGSECLLSFRIETNRRIRCKGLTNEKPQWRSGVFWYGSDGRQCAVSPVEFVITGDTTAYLRVMMPTGAVACSVQIGFDTPDVLPGHKLIIRDVRLCALKGCVLSKTGSFSSEVCHGGAVSWNAETPPGTSVRFQYAAADSPEDVLSAPFCGPDGSENSFFDVPFVAKGGWVRYKAFLVSEGGSASPKLSSVTVGGVEDAGWRPFADVLPPFVAVVGGASSPNADRSIEIEISDQSAVSHRTFRADIDGADATHRFTRTGDRYIVSAPSDGWASGLHTMDVSIADCHGNAMTARRYFFVGEGPDTPKVTLRDDGRTLVDGKPFFPIGLYAVCKREFNGNDFDRAFADMRAGGFNFAHTYGEISVDFLDAANKYGMKLWCAVRPSQEGLVMDSLRHNPAVLAWYLGDDTSDNTTPEELMSRESFVKAIDPTRISCQADPVGPREFSRIASRYADYVGGTDVFMPELYPVRGAAGDETDSNFVAKIIHDMESISEDARRNGDGRPHGVWAIIQYFKGWGNWGHFPTKEQLSAMTWAAVVHGASGIAWYTYGGFYDKVNKMDNQGVASTPERWRNVCEVATRLKELSPFLVERPPKDQPKVYVVSGAAVDPFGRPAVTCLLKRHGGIATLIAVNAAPEPTKVSFAVRGCAEADVLWEGRRVPFKQNGLEDEFAPFAVHIYQWQDAVAESGSVDAVGCHAEWNGARIKVGNALFSREYAAMDGVLRTMSFKDADGAEWQRDAAAGKGDRASVGASSPAVAVEALSGRWSPVGVEGLCVKVSIQNRAIELWLFPGVPGVITRRQWRDAVKPVHDIDRDFRSLKEDNDALMAAIGRCDSIRFRPLHIRAKSITCLDQTDIRDNLVLVEDRLLMAYDWKFTLAASALDCRDVLTGDGMTFVRLAPMPSSRHEKTDDFILDGEGRQVALLANGYPLVELLYKGGDAGRQRAVVAFQRAIRPYRAGRDGMLLSNTWGGGNRDARINQEFLLKEIEAGAKIGVDVLQIDDGWQRGRTSNSKREVLSGKKKVWNGYWAADPDFWKEDLERFPDGLDLIVRRAAEKGMRFGLWFGPDSSDDAANWKRDADCLLDFHRRLGVEYFKMDSMKLLTPLALKRNRMMFDRMQELSDGAMVFDLDCTAEIRPGFMGLLDVGPMFVENRYTLKPVYWPHHTLKNLWDLSHLVDPVRLRMEFNNPDTNHGNYSESPLGHQNYCADTLFATVMAASPLAWMELSDVSDESVSTLAALVKTWKKERARWHGGVIHPVGNRPDGISWTGFVSEADDGNGGYALLFRELNNAQDFTLELSPVVENHFISCVEVIGGRGKAVLDGSRLTVTIPEKLDFVWAKFGR